MSDHEIRTLLRDVAEDVQDIRPLGRKALRRTRTRRWAVATTVVTSIVTIAAAGTSFALNAGPFRDDAIVAPANDSTPPREMPGTLVAHGTAEDGSHWWLSAYENDAAQLCVNLQHNGVIAEDCAYYDSEGTGLGHHPNEDEANSLFGWVPDDTERMWVTWGAEVYHEAGPEDDEDGDGVATSSDQDCPGVKTSSDKGDGDGGVETSSDQDCPGVATSSDEDEPDQGPDVEIRGDEEVRLYDAPEGFRFPVKFYALVPAPEAAGAYRIEVRGGDVTVLIFSKGSGVEFGEWPPSAGDLVAEGAHGGHVWELYVRTPGDKRCLHLIWADEAYGSSEGCSTAVPRAESFQFTMNRFDGEGSGTVALYAALAPEVEVLELELDGGEAMPVEILEGPPGSEVDYGVAWPPLDDDGSTGGWATSYDADGNVLDRMKLCELAGSSGCASDSPPPAP